MTVIIVLAIEEIINDNDKNLIKVQGKHIDFDMTVIEATVAREMLKDIKEWETDTEESESE
jgi:hypothetical protein